MVNKFKFIFLSFLGFVFFLVPFEIAGESSIMISHTVNFVTGNFFDLFILFTRLCAWIVMIGTVIFTFYTSQNKYLNSVFKTSPFNIFLRVAGSFLYLMVVNGWFEQAGIAQVILDGDTGGLMAGEGGLLTTLYITFFVGILALPLLTHFGVVEFLGVLLGPVVVKVFKVPGYSTIDAIASFVGDGTIGIVVTDTQYQRGYYSKREAYVIATSFSVVGIAFAAAVAQELGFSSIFPIFYGSIIVVTLLLAFITARLPLKKFPQTYYEGKTPKETEIPEGKSIWKHAYDSAIEQADSTSVGEAFKEAFKNIVNIYVSFLPVIMAIGTISLIIAEYTPFFAFISAPLVYVYDFIGFSTEVARQMAPASVAGFADMYLPALFITESASEASRFFIGVLAFTQLVFMSETGMILVKTKIGLNFWDVLKVFLFRTIISIPILLAITNLLAYLGIISF
ncbi:YjiH family protein [Marinilactibacillus psychrotolerans]|uniref:Membrane protein n=1 Tax=Marinilactibacillus psychrotolerans TaxID=191770 RepID=A0AAV3WQB4_9LACT|nr:nucleoside recognition domain-containing protein [Marinilactibacillus psychrotolerans]GEL66868.1 membrane protein [Marinilactibacillus psychrotolerans]GEQ35974.1 membrane protein [Marinilactibacillus psychrotolerans]SDC40664.1 nucleoside recognition GATE domain-containing membrane protein YjiH [Marinilactibacillus psychrotolerans]